MLSLELLREECAAMEGRGERAAMLGEGLVGYERWWGGSMRGRRGDPWLIMGRVAHVL